MRTRKVLSIILALAMILTMAPISVGSFAIDVGNETVDVNKATNDELVRPNATVEVTPVTRACASLSTPLYPATSSSAVVTAATPSGIAKNSYTFASALYGGETPVSTTIKFTPGVAIDESTLSISCSNTSVQLIGPTSPSAGVYVWTVSDGASVALGEILTFYVTYKYEYQLTSDGKTYNKDKTFTTTGYSYVESVVSPAGTYSHRRTYISYWVGSKNVNRAYVASYILGAGVYTYSSTTGGFDPNTGDGTDSSAFGKLLYVATSGTSKYYNPGYKVDDNRPLSTIYYDIDKGSTLSAQNIRFVATMPARSSESDQQTSIKIGGLYEYSGFTQTFDTDEGEDRSTSSSTTTELGLTATTAGNTGISSVGSYFTIPLNGNGAAGQYTALLDLNTPGYWDGVYTRHSHSFLIVRVNKGALRTALQNVVNADVSGPLVTDDDSGKGYNPQSWYYVSGWANYATAYAEAQRIYAKPNASQEEIDSAATSLNTAYSELVLNDADYTELNLYYNKALALDESNYDPSTWAVLETALAKYETGYSILYQPKVDALATEIKNAINNLKFIDADYSAVDEKVDAINNNIQELDTNYGLTPSEYYTNWSVVTDVLANCGYYYDETSMCYVLDPEQTKTKADQSVVDGYPLLIQTAVNQLTVRTADYTATRTALAAYSTFKTSTAAYVTDESLAAIESAYTTLYNLYSPAKTIEYQNDIDAAVTALNDALANYQYKSADYTAANTAKQAYLDLDRSIYKDLTEVDSAYQALVALDGLDARSQSQIDAAVKTLNNAIKNLEKNAADYSAVNAAIDVANAENTRITELYKDTLGLTAATYYSNWSAVTSAINAVNWTLDVTQQSTVDSYATAITNAYNALIENDADYTALNNAVDTAYTYFDDAVSANYTQDSIDNLLSAVMAVDYNKKIHEQSDVDEYTADILEAINNLEKLPADYTAVNTAITNANAKKTLSADFATAHHGYPYYTAASIENLDSKISAVVWNLDITKQTQVNNYATVINNAISALVIAPADYTDVNTAKATVPADLSLYTDASKAVLTSALAYNKNLKANNQATVDGFDDAIYAAIDGLKYKSIDTTAYTAAKKTIPTDLSVYTTDSAAAVTNQVSVIETFLKGSVDIRNQADLDSMVETLNTKISQLELKPLLADYTAVENAKKAANAALESENAQYYTDASKQAVTDAVDAVVPDLLESEQERVDGFATAINNAVAALAYKPISTTGFDAAFARYNAVANKSNYTDASLKAVTDKITEASTLLDGEVDIRNQAELDAIVAEINTAIDNLKLKGADYTAVNEAKASAAALEPNKALYVDFTGVENAVAAVVDGLTIDKQSTVDGYATAINNAIKALEFKAIDRKAYDTAVQRYEAVENKSNYTDASLKVVTDKITEGANLLNGDVDIRNQAELDSIVGSINTAIDNLALKAADYTALNALITEFLGLDETLYKNYDAAYDVFADVRTWKNNNGNLKITDQALIDEQKDALQEAIDSLIAKPIDTTGYVAAKGTIPADLSIYTDATVKAVNDQIDAIDDFLAGNVDIRNQAELDEMVEVLKTKISELAYKPADYTALNAVLSEFLDIDETLYSNYEAAYDVFADARSWKNNNANLTADKQSLIDEQTALVRAAIDGLILNTPTEYFKVKEGSTTKIATNGQITGLKTELTRSELVNQFLETNVASITYTKAVKTSKYYGTGSTITVNYANGTTEVYTIVIYGDVDGNGLIDVDDASLVSVASEDSSILTTAQAKAANVDGVRRVTANDAAVIYLVAQGHTIDQLDPTSID